MQAERRTKFIWFCRGAAYLSGGLSSAKCASWAQNQIYLGFCRGAAYLSGGLSSAKIRISGSKNKPACTLPSGSIFDEVKGTNNSGKAVKPRLPEAFFQPKVIFSARKCAKIKNMSIFAVPKQRFWVGRAGASPPPATEKERCRSGRSGRTRKCGVRVTVPGVRIPPSPQQTLKISRLQNKHPVLHPRM